MTNSPRLTIVAPCYRGVDELAELHRRVAQAAEAVVGNDFEFIMVNDGSPDETWSVICALGDADARVVGVNLSRNHGHQLALSAGLSLARGERVFMLDADLQDPPELLPLMMRALDEGADVAYGQRTRRHGESIFKRASAALFYRLLDRLTEVRIPQDTGDFRLITRRVLDALNGMPESHRFVRGMVSWIGFRQVAVPYERPARAIGHERLLVAQAAAAGVRRDHRVFDAAAAGRIAARHRLRLPGRDRRGAHHHRLGPGRRPSPAGPAWWSSCSRWAASSSRCWASSASTSAACLAR